MDRQEVTSRMGELIHRKRLAARLTQVELAERIGVTQVVVSGWERGKLPNPVVVGKLLDALEITSEEFASVYREPAA